MLFCWTDLHSPVPDITARILFELVLEYEMSDQTIHRSNDAKIFAPFMPLGVNVLLDSSPLIQNVGDNEPLRDKGCTLSGP